MCVVKLLQMAQRHVWSLVLSPLLLISLSIALHCWLVVALVRGSFGLLQGCLIVSHSLCHFGQKCLLTYYM